MKKYPLVEDLGRPVPRVAMPRAPRMQVPGGTMHVVVRCNNREFCFAMVADFELVLAGGAEERGRDGESGKRGSGGAAEQGRG